MLYLLEIPRWSTLLQKRLATELQSACLGEVLWCCPQEPSSRRNRMEMCRGRKREASVRPSSLCRSLAIPLC